MSELSVVEDAPAVADPSAVLPAASANGSANGAAMQLLAANGASVMDSPSRALVSAIPGDTLMRLPSVPEDHDDDFEDDDGAAEVGDGKFIFTNSVGEVKSYLDRCKDRRLRRRCREVECRPWQALQVAP